MSSSYTFLTLSLLIASVYCNHDQHNHHRDDKWITFVSKIESFWKTDTSVTPTETHTEISISSKDVYISERTTEATDYNSTPETPLLNGSRNINDVMQDDVIHVDSHESFKMGVAAIISIPIVGVIVLICCCYWICKCCCGMCASDRHVVVMNSNMVQHAQPASVQPTQVIVQQPIYQHPPPAHQEMNQYPPPHQQWGPPQFQQQMPPQFQQQMPPPQYYPGGGIENPNFYHAAAPPQMATEKY